jgi:hypothetical protein
MVTAADVLKMVKDNEVKFVDFRFTDTRGKEQHVSVPVKVFDMGKFDDGHAFDGSSIAGWKGIQASDMLLMPDPSSARMDPFTDEPVLNMLNQVIERCLEKDPERRFQSARELFSIRGAQLVLGVPTPEGGDADRTEAIDNVVAYREPPGWLTWSGPVLLVLIVAAFVVAIVVRIWSPNPLVSVRGCVQSSTGPQAVLTVALPLSQRGERRTLVGSGLLDGYDFRPEIGREIEVAYTDFFRRVQATGVDVSHRGGKPVAGSLVEGTFAVTRKRYIGYAAEPATA